MNAILIDTSSWISYFAGRGHEDIDVALREGRVFLSPIVAAELLSGVLKDAQRSTLIDMLLELPLCETPIEHWVHVGRLRSELIQQGLKVSTPDAHIVQCCLDLNCFLLSEDKIFAKIALKHPLRLYEPAAT